MLALAGVVCGSQVPAAEPGASTVTEAAFFDEFPVVISVSRLSQPLPDAPGAVTVIDRELIRLSGARTLAEVLRLVPGFQVAANEYGAPVATYHGPVEEFPHGLQVLIDGRSQYSPVTLGGVNWSALPLVLDDIERIEVTRGSNSASYGANAFLGIVNIVTRPAAQDRGMTVEVRRGQGGIKDELLRLGERDELTFMAGALRGKLSATYRTVGKMQWTNGAGFRVSRYSTTDWRLAHRFRIGDARGELAFTVRDDGHAHEEFRRTEYVAPRGYVSLRFEL